jgi:hypothetical protein
MVSIFCLYFAVFARSARAGERYEFYNGVRQMAMGGAAIAVVNDESALLLNPAGLGKLRDYILTVADPEIDVSQNIEKIVGTDVLGTMDPQAVLNKLNDGNQDEHLHARAQVFPSLVVPNFGIGLFAKYSMDAEVNSETSKYDIDYLNDMALVLGFNFRIWDGRIKFGFNTRFVNRAQIHDSFDDSSTDLTVNGLADEGVGIGSDLGVVLTAPWDWLPTLAAVWRDVGGTAYDVREGLFIKTEDDRRPDHTPQSLDVALALFPIGGKRTRFTWTAEYQDVLTSGDETDQMRRLHTGLELNWADAAFLRAGMNQRYWTAGLELSMGNIQLQLASYGEEIGTKEKTREDRRYNAKFSYRF